MLKKSRRNNLLIRIESKRSNVDLLSLCSFRQEKKKKEIISKLLILVDLLVIPFIYSLTFAAVRFRHVLAVNVTFNE